MKVCDIKTAQAEAKRFLSAVAHYRNVHLEDWEKEKYMIWASKESAAVRRASMDLTRSLAVMRKP